MKLFSVLLGFSFATAALASGGSHPKDPDKLPPMDQDVTPIQLSPETLRKRLFDENLDIRFAANNVHIAKVNVNKARSDLLPTLQLNGIMSSFANPTFILSSVESLLPFLMPSRWFDMFQMEKLLEADKKSYQILQLNTYSSAYSLYQTIYNDQQLRDLFGVDLKDWQNIEAITKFQFELGRATDNEVKLATAQRALAKVRFETLEGLLISEMGNLRYALGYNPKRPISLVPTDIPDSEFVASPIDAAIKTAYDRSIEREQIGFLIEAAKYQKWSRVFSFIDGVGISTSAGSGDRAPSFGASDLRVGGSLSFSFGQFDLVKLSELTIKEYHLRQEELARELTRTLDVVLGQLPTVVSKLQAAKESEDSFRSNYANNQFKYELGQITFRDLLISRLDIAEATTERIRAQTDLAQLRITLHRTFRTDNFATINGCAVPNTAANRKKYGKTKADDYCLRVNP